MTFHLYIYSYKRVFANSPCACCSTQKRQFYLQLGESAENEMFKSSPTPSSHSRPTPTRLFSHAERTAFLHRLYPKRFTTCFTFKPRFQRATVRGSSRTIRSNLMCYLKGIEWTLLWELFCGKYLLDAAVQLLLQMLIWIYIAYYTCYG